jgi:hypothetical protein
LTVFGELHGLTDLTVARASRFSERVRFRLDRLEEEPMSEERQEPSDVADALWRAYRDGVEPARIATAADRRP